MSSGFRIAFSYKARSGKDTCAEYVMNQYGGKVVKFADSLYELMYKIQEHCGFSKEKDSHLLQQIGTNYARAKDEDVWVKKTVAKIESFDQSENLYVTDARFPNEIEALRKLGFIVCKVNRSVEARGDIGRDPNHPSEIALDGYNDWDFVIENDGSLEDLYRKVDSILNTCYNNKL